MIARTSASKGEACVVVIRRGPTLATTAAITLPSFGSAALKTASMLEVSAAGARVVPMVPAMKDFGGSLVFAMRGRPREVLFAGSLRWRPRPRIRGWRDAPRGKRCKNGNLLGRHLSERGCRFRHLGETCTIATFDPASFLDSIVSLTAAFTLGTAIGAERQYRQRSAGLRTNVLVAVGAASFVDLVIVVGGADGAIRVIAYVVSGIGFLGAGVIMKDGATSAGSTRRRRSGPRPRWAPAREQIGSLKPSW